MSENQPVAFLMTDNGTFVMKYSPESVSKENSTELSDAPVWGQRVKSLEWLNVKGRTLSVSNVQVDKYRENCGSIQSIIEAVEKLMDPKGNKPPVATFLYGNQRFGPAVLLSWNVEEYLWTKERQLSHAKVSFMLRELPED